MLSISKRSSSGASASFFSMMVEEKARAMAEKNGSPFVDNEMPYSRAERGKPVVVDYFYHEEIRGSANTGKRRK